MLPKSFCFSGSVYLRRIRADSVRCCFNSAFSSGGIGNILFSLISFFPFYPRFYVLFYPGCTPDCTISCLRTSSLVILVYNRVLLKLGSVWLFGSTIDFISSKIFGNFVSFFCAHYGCDHLWMLDHSLILLFLCGLFVYSTLIRVLRRFVPAGATFSW